MTGRIYGKYAPSSEKDRYENLVNRRDRLHVDCKQEITLSRNQAVPVFLDSIPRNHPANPVSLSIAKKAIRGPLPC